MSAELHLISGMAGAGKTTLAKRIEQESGAIRLSPDEWLVTLMQDPADRAEMDRLREPVEKLQWELAQRLLGEGLIVVLENGFWRRDERLEYCREAQAIGAMVTLYFLDPSKRELLRRIEKRNPQLQAQALRISETELNTWLGWLERPDEEELAAYDVFHKSLGGDNVGEP